MDIFAHFPWANNNLKIDGISVINIKCYIEFSHIMYF